jgi:hypothetical protein
MLLGEVIVADAIAKLKAGYAARVTAINAEKADDNPIQAPATEAYYAGRMETLPGVPAVFVLEGATRFAGEGSHGLHSSMQLRVFVADQGETGPRLAQKLQRQVRAIIEVLYDDEPQERLAHAYNITPLVSKPGAVFEPDGEHTWRGIYELDFLVRQVEI